MSPDRAVPTAATVAAYDRDAVAYAEASAPLSDRVRAALAELRETAGAGARVLEIGSGGGRDALAMEELGLRVRRTDVTPGFVALLRAAGHPADVLDPLTDDLAVIDGPYDAVWANASLLHVRRDDLGTVLARLAAVTRPGGLLRASFKQGGDEGWSTHGAVRAARHFTYWQPEAVRRVVAAAGWTDLRVDSGIPGRRGERWLEVAAVRADRVVRADRADRVGQEAAR